MTGSAFLPDTESAEARNTVVLPGSTGRRFQAMRRKSSVIGLFAAYILGGCDSGTVELRLVAPESPLDRAIAEDMVELFDESSAVQLTIVETSMAEEAALDAVTAGDADIALISNNLPFRDDIATVMPLYPTVLHIARHNGLPDHPDIAARPDLLALRGVSVFAGPEGSASRYLFSRVSQRIGLTDDIVRFVDDPNDNPDLIIVFAPISPDVADAAGDYVLVSLGTPDQMGSGGPVDAATLLNPTFVPFIIPEGVYGRSMTEPVVTIAVDKMIVTRRDLDPTVVYDLIDEIVRLRPALSANRPGLFTDLSGDFDASRSTFVVHSGAQDYLRRTAPTVYERYSGIAEVVVTAFVAVASATFAGVRLYRLRRKNRIDRYYAATIQIRKTLKAISTEAERQTAASQLRALQDEAFDLLVNEKLAADESFMIFITLSNEVLHQLEVESTAPGSA